MSERKQSQIMSRNSGKTNLNKKQRKSNFLKISIKDLKKSDLSKRYKFSWSFKIHLLNSNLWK